MYLVSNVSVQQWGAMQHRMGTQRESVRLESFGAATGPTVELGSMRSADPPPPSRAAQAAIAPKSVNVAVRACSQFAALSYKNLILLLRFWRSSLCIVLAPMILIIIVGCVAMAETSAAGDGVPTPLPFATLSSASGRANEGFPLCRVFDGADGKYGLGTPIPGAKCNSLLFAPSGNPEVLKVRPVVCGVWWV